MSKAKKLVYIPKVSSVLLPVIEHLTGLESWDLFAADKSQVEDAYGFQELGTSAEKWSAGNKDTLQKELLDSTDLPADASVDVVLIADGDLFEFEMEDIPDPLFNNAGMIVVLLTGPEMLREQVGTETPYREKMIGLRPIYQLGKLAGLELVREPATESQLLKDADRLFETVGLPVHFLNYDLPGGAALRIQAQVFTEAWRMFRENGIQPALLDHIANEALGLEEGLLQRIAREGASNWGNDLHRLARCSGGDSRFRTRTDEFPDAPGYGIWDALKQEPTPLEGPTPATAPNRILIVGTPHLVDLWREQLYTSTEGKVDPDAWRIWDLGAVQQSELDAVAERGPYDLVLEVLVGPSEDRQQLLTALLPHLSEQAHVWVQTLNLASTVIVPVVPEELCAVGFSGIPSQGDRPIVELARPRNSDASDLLRAAGLARLLGLEPYEIADEPGGVGPRLLATVINAASFLVREGIISSEAEADRIAKLALGMNSGPFELADVVGLDSIEGVLIGLQAFLGEDRYRVSPLLTLRIESGALGQVTDSGFYI